VLSVRRAWVIWLTGGVGVALIVIKSEAGVVSIDGDVEFTEVDGTVEVKAAATVSSGIGCASSVATAEAVTGRGTSATGPKLSLPCAEPRVSVEALRLLLPNRAESPVTVLSSAAIAPGWPCAVWTFTRIVGLSGVGIDV
jgi:hypothetical protein